MSTASLIKKMSGKSISVTGFTHCINKSILHPGNNDVNCISEDVHNSLDEQIRKSVDPILQRPSEKIFFSLEFQAIPNTFLFIS
jgi:hypothetical protein